MQDVLKRYNCKTSSEFVANEDCMDICSFCILQIDSLSRQLTTESYKALNFISTGILIPVQKMIAHDYIKLNRQVLYLFVVDCCSNQSYLQVKDRIKYCQENKRTK